MGKLNIIAGKQIGALKICLYGVEGIGKSTLASHFPRPLFIDTEGSTKFLDVQRTKRPASWTELLDQVACVWEDPSICDTLVIDTVDWAEKLCIKAVCAQYQKDGIECFDFGKGYTFVYERFGSLLNLLSDLTEKGVNVLLIGHATMDRVEQPEEFGTYDRWGLKVLNSRKCSIANMVTEWADATLFANYKTLVVATDNKGKKHKAQGGRRVLYTTHHPCWDAKNRLGMPEEMAMEWDALAPYLRLNDGAQVDGGRPQGAPTEGIQRTSGAEETRAETEPEKKPEPPAAAPDSPAGPVPAALVPLLESAGVTEEEVRKVIAKRQGSFPMGTTWQVMEECGFVQGWVLPYWQKIVAMIQEDPDRLPFTM